MYRIFLQFCSHQTGSAQGGCGGCELFETKVSAFRFHSQQTVMPTLPLLAGDLRFFASSQALPLWHINLPLLTSTINIEYLVKNKTDLVLDLAHF